MIQEKSEKLFEGIGQIDDSIIIQADADPIKPRRISPNWMKWGGLAAACLLAIVGIVFNQGPQRVDFAPPPPVDAPAAFGAAEQAAPRYGTGRVDRGLQPNANFNVDIVLEEAYDWGAAPGMPAEAADEGAGLQNAMRGMAPAEHITARIVVTTFNLHAETMDFEGSVSFINSATHGFGGYIQSSSVDGRSHFDYHSTRWAHFTLRIPSGKIHEFVAVLGDNTNIVSTQEHADDITDSFFDNQARLASLLNQESLLSALLEDEDAGLEYILEVHRELAVVRYQIEAINSIIQRMEQAVSYSTAHVSLVEVMHYRPVDDLPTTFNQRVNLAMSNSWDHFVRSAQNTIIRIIWAAPFFFMNILYIAVLLVILLIVRRLIRKKKGKNRGESTFDWPWIRK